jgi:hypothetical protein
MFFFDRISAGKAVELATAKFTPWPRVNVPFGFK